MSEAGRSTEERLRRLFGLARTGQPRADTEFLQALSRHLRGFLRKRLPWQPDEVDDLVQESLLAIHLQCDRYDPAQPFTPWAQAVARNKLVDFLRQHERHGRRNDPLEDCAELAARDEAAARDARRDLARLLAALPERQRLPIVHTKLEGRSVAEAARLTGLSESAVKVGVHRGLHALRGSRETA